MNNRRIKTPPKGKSRLKTSYAEGKSTQQKKPKFSLEHLQDPYCVCRCDKDDRAAFATKLRELSQLTWSEITCSGRHGLGFEKIDRTSIKAPIPEHITDDVNLIAFRFSGKKPMVGYRSYEIFYIVWCDLFSLSLIFSIDL
jgi:hypothetical protein